MMTIKVFYFLSFLYEFFLDRGFTVNLNICRLLSIVVLQN